MTGLWRARLSHERASSRHLVVMRSSLQDMLCIIPAPSRRSHQSDCWCYRSMLERRMGADLSGSFDKSWSSSSCCWIMFERIDVDQAMAVSVGSA